METLFRILAATGLPDRLDEPPLHEFHVLSPPVDQLLQRADPISRSSCARVGDTDADSKQVARKGIA